VEGVDGAVFVKFGATVLRVRVVCPMHYLGSAGLPGLTFDQVREGTVVFTARTMFLQTLGT